MTITDEGATEQTRQIIHHHAVLRRGLERRSGALCEAVESGVPFERQMTMLRDYLTGEILPHAKAEEATLYQAAGRRARVTGGAFHVSELRSFSGAAHRHGGGRCRGPGGMAHLGAARRPG